MKNNIGIFLLFLWLSSISLNAQEIPRNEVNYNILNTIIFASVEVGYEFFIDYDQSIGAKLLINDRRNFKNESHGQKYNTNSIQLNYSYYFGINNPGSELYIQPFVKYRFGDFKEEKENPETAAIELQKTDMNTFIIGLGAGYTWNFSNSFVMGPYVNFGRNFSSEVKERFSAFDFYGGFAIGYRF